MDRRKFLQTGAVGLGLALQGAGSSRAVDAPRILSTHPGGVAANRRLREETRRAAESAGFRAVFPPSDLCTDNAAMIAAAGAALLARGEAHGLDLNSFSRVPIGSAPWSPGGPA